MAADPGAACGDGVEPGDPVTDDDDGREPFRELVVDTLTNIERKLDALMASQDEINAAVTALQNDETGLDASVAKITAEIAALKTANPAVDTTALSTEVANLATHVATIATL